MPKLEVVNANNVIEFNPQKANFKLKNTGGPKGETGAQGPKGDTGPQGLQGPAGASASVTVGSTTTLSPGADATVTNSGDTRNAILNFGIPTGARGPKGDTGSKGDTGPMGPKGAKGDTGAAATVQVGNTNTGAPGTNAQVTNAGNEHFAVFNFTIPRGDKGEKGATGATGPQGPAGQDGTDGFSPIATVTQEGLDAEISITDKDGTTTATVPGFGVQVVESLPATGSSNIIYLERDSNSASGNPISIADAVEAPLKSLEIQGETSQNGTPNPDYPQAVQTVTGENVVKICGKNLFDKNSISTGYLNADGTLSSDSAYKTSDFIAVKSNTVYYKTYTASPRTKYFNSARQPLNTTTYQDIPIGGAAGTFTTPANAAYVRFSFPVAGVNLDTTQLELGSTATAYEPYQGQSYEVNLGNIELCKIGTYQDYIWKDGDTWKVHKATSKANLATDRTSLGKISSGSSFRGFTVSVNTGANVRTADGGVVVPLVCNMLSCTNRDMVYQVGSKNNISVGTPANEYYKDFFFDPVPINGYSVADAETWLNNNPIIVYYPLATPTDTEITNEALIAQLEAILAGGTQAGENTITLTPSAEATGTLEVEYYDSYDSYLWVNNRWEKFAHLG